MAILDFSVSGWHGFGSVTQVCFGISVSNFMCMSLVAVGRRIKIVSYVAFNMPALWFWTMFNCNPPIAHCHPLLWGGGILVDHWSTISSFSRKFNKHSHGFDVSELSFEECHLIKIEMSVLWEWQVSLDLCLTDCHTNELQKCHDVPEPDQNQSDAESIGLILVRFCHMMACLQGGQIL